MSFTWWLMFLFTLLVNWGLVIGSLTGFSDYELWSVFIRYGYVNWEIPAKIIIQIWIVDALLVHLNAGIGMMCGRLTLVKMVSTLFWNDFLCWTSNQLFIFKLNVFGCMNAFLSNTISIASPFHGCFMTLWGIYFLHVF